MIDFVMLRSAHRLDGNYLQRAAEARICFDLILSFFLHLFHPKSDKMCEMSAPWGADY